MPFPLPENFQPGTPLRELVTTESMRTVAGILNHLTVEVREGVDYPYIEKTARPGEQQPWVIVIPPANSGVSDAYPLADAEYAAPGTGVQASRADHVHPLSDEFWELWDWAVDMTGWAGDVDADLDKLWTWGLDVDAFIADTDAYLAAVDADLDTLFANDTAFSSWSNAHAAYASDTFADIYNWLDYILANL